MAFLEEVRREEKCAILRQWGRCAGLINNEKKFFIDYKMSFRGAGRQSREAQLFVPALCTRVARFFLVQHTKTGENIPNYHKVYQMAVK
jgi:hypothetical protein